MNMTLGLRKFALTAHVASSVGWLGSVGVFFALAIAGLLSPNPDVVQAVYLTLELTGWFVIVPLALASLPTGLVMSLGTEWGLVRHYWVMAKLLITVFATFLLLVHMRPVGHLAQVVAETTLLYGEYAALQLQLVANAGAAIVALLIATALSVYKPKGLTPYGRRHLLQEHGRIRRIRASEAGVSGWIKGLGIAAIIGVMIVLALHLMGRGFGGH